MILKIATVLILCVLFFSSTAFAAYGAGSGDGSDEAHAILIDSVGAWNTLAATACDWSKYVKVTQDIDFGGATVTSLVATKFSGTFDGDGHTFSNLVLIKHVKAGRTFVALFNMAAASAVIKDLTLNGVTVNETSISPANSTSYCAALVGETSAWDASDAYNGTCIINCHVVNANIQFTQNVATQNAHVGVLVGANHGNATGCTTSGTLKAIIANGATLNIGGMVGYQTESATGGKAATGLTNCVSSVAISSIDDTALAATSISIGGITGSLANSQANGTYITGCGFTGSIVYTADEPLWVGGIVGYAAGIISNCYATGNITIRADSDASLTLGSFVGLMKGTISNSYSNCNTSIYFWDTGWYIGGFAGRTLSGSSLTDCYALGTIYDAKESGTSLSYTFGGFVGYAPTSTFTRCWSAIGPYSAKTGNNYVKGFVAVNSSSTYTNCFWNTTLGVASTAGTATGKTTTQLQTIGTYTDAEWDFVNIWRICDGMNYPKLLWQQKPGVDFICPDGVNAEDLVYFARHWLESDCGSNNNCDGSDLNHSGFIDGSDFAIFAENWLQAVE